MDVDSLRALLCVPGNRVNTDPSYSCLTKAQKRQRSKRKEQLHEKGT
jgi:hypothetical protein